MHRREKLGDDCKTCGQRRRFEHARTIEVAQSRDAIEQLLHTFGTRVVHEMYHDDTPRRQLLRIVRTNALIESNDLEQSVAGVEIVRHVFESWEGLHECAPPACTVSFNDRKAHAIAHLLIATGVDTLPRVLATSKSSMRRHSCPIRHTSDDRRLPA
jgi:hypothetical protein